jgi:hypothetical protein
MRSAPQPSLPLNRWLLGASVCPDVPPAIHTVPVPILPPSNLKAFNVFRFNYLPPLCVSLPSFFARRPVFSITSSLFSQNTRGGGASANAPLRINNIQTLFPRPCLQSSYQSRPSPESFLCALGAVACHDRVGVANPVFVRPLFSYSYELLVPQLPCFHNHPHWPGGVPSNSRLLWQLSDYPLPTTHFPT